jgi:hypothetical protein
MSRFSTIRAEVAAQLMTQARLRVGLIAIIAILWVYGLLVAGDQAVAIGASTKLLREEVARVQPLAKERGWAERAEDARRQLTAVQGMQWVESDLGLVEARFQDWLRATAAKSGLSVRDLVLTRALNAAPAAAASAPVAGPQVIRARLVVDHNRLALLAFLSEVGRNERVIVVDRLLMRLAAQPSIAELELHILGGVQAPGEQTATGASLNGPEKGSRS